jgi:hypothetical protein
MNLDCLFVCYGCLGMKHPSGAYEQIFITVRELQTIEELLE